MLVPPVVLLPAQADFIAVDFRYLTARD